MEPELIELVKKAEIFSDWDDEDLQHFLDKIELIQLYVGGILFEQGDESDCMYLLLKGDLIGMALNSLGVEITFGYIRAGQIVGEMGLISSQLRTLTIKALSNAILIKISRNIFEEYFVSKPQLLYKMLTLVIKRAQNTIDSTSNIKKRHFIALLPANENTAVNVLFEKIGEMLANNSKITLLSKKDLASLKTYDEVKRLLSKVSRSSDFIIYVVDLNNTIIKEALLEYATRVLVIAQGDTEPVLDEYVKQVLSDAAYEHINKELILVYDNLGFIPTHTTQWLNTSQFNKHFHVPLHEIGYQYLSRLLTGRAIGLVLSGGGTKGWVHVGAIRALCEANIPIDAIGGTSVGAIVGACYLMQGDFTRFLKAMREFNRMTQKMATLSDLTYPLISLLDGKKRVLSLQHLFNDMVIENLVKPFFCISADLSDNLEVIHTRDSLWQWVCASSSLPGLLPPMTDKGKIYLDGGVVNNLPVDVMKAYLGTTGKTYCR